MPTGLESDFASPTRSRARISPDGTKVAYLAPWPAGVGQGRLNVFVRDLGGGWPDPDAVDDPAARRVTSDDRRSIETFLSTADSRFLLFLQDTDGEENAHLHRIDLDRAGGPDAVPAVDLTPIDGARVVGTQLVPEQPGTVLVQLNAPAEHADACLLHRPGPPRLRPPGAVASSARVFRVRESPRRFWR